MVFLQQASLAEATMAYKTKVPTVKGHATHNSHAKHTVKAQVKAEESPDVSDDDMESDGEREEVVKGFQKHLEKHGSKAGGDSLASMEDEGDDWAGLAAEEKALTVDEKAEEREEGELWQIEKEGGASSMGHGDSMMV